MKILWCNIAGNCSKNIWYEYSEFWEVDFCLVFGVWCFSFINVEYFKAHMFQTEIDNQLNN